jgi:GH18 family chitinase
MIMKTSDYSLSKFLQASVIAICLSAGISNAAFAQISFEGERSRADSRKIRREAARYKADDVKDSHLNMGMYSYKRGAAGKKAKNEELETDEIYNGPNPVKNERRLFKKKK